jgi:hypothetical protein
MTQATSNSGMPGDADASGHGWLVTETLKTRVGDFGFKNGFPVGDTTARNNVYYMAAGNSCRRRHLREDFDKTWQLNDIEEVNASQR